jgi:hypothetical protein
MIGGNMKTNILVQVTYTGEEAQLVIDALEIIQPDDAGRELLAREMALEMREALRKGGQG